FAEDVAALSAQRGLGRAVVGGISMGAAISLRLAVRRPDLVGGLILARPAWLFESGPENMQMYARVGELLAQHDPQTAKTLFKPSPLPQRVSDEAPDNLASLLGFFDYPNLAPLSALLRAIAADGPGVSEAEAKAIAVPTLVIGHAEDLAHPLAYAEKLA